MKYLPLILICLMSVAMLGNDGCNNGEEPAAIDPDVVVLSVASGATAAGSAMLVNPSTWSEAVVGLVLKGWGDATIDAVVPMKQAIESGNCTGQTGSFTIDPSPYVNLPGAPTTPEEIDAAKEEVERVLALVLPSVSGGVTIFSGIAKADGDETGCIVLTCIADFTAPAGELSLEILKIVEVPGEEFTFPGMQWDCTACKE